MGLAKVDMLAHMDKLSKALYSLQNKGSLLASGSTKINF